MPSPQYVEQEWKDAGEPGATPIWADIADAGAGPSLQRTEQGIVAAHEDALEAHALATAAIPKPGSPATDGVVQYNGSVYVTAKIGSANVTDASLPPSKLTPGTNGESIIVVGGVATWGTISGIPLRAILPFHMDTGSEPIPTGFAVCNGQVILAANHDLGGGDYTMPDLRNRFILGADPAKAVGNAGGTADTSADAPGPKGLGGSQSHTITTAQLPAHDHGGGVHSHTITDPGHSHGTENASGNSGATYRQLVKSTFVSDAVDSAADGTWILANTTGISVNNSATIITSVGSGSAFDKRPRFYGLVLIMKIKN